jgi:hypothetical protein
MHAAPPPPRPDPAARQHRVTVHYPRPTLAAAAALMPDR